jgi:hypothetical protein
MNHPVSDRWIAASPWLGLLATVLLLSACAPQGPSVPALPSAPPSSPAVRPTTTSPQAPTLSPKCEPSADGTFRAVVLGTSNIFGAGRATAPAPGGGGAGTLPPACELAAGSAIVTFTSATGEVTPYTDQPLRNGPAGDHKGAGGENTDVTSYQGISGIINRGNGMFLVGVFLTDAVPADPAPPRLDFTRGEDLEELAPEIAQTFLIGDGIGRTYRVPSGATRLFLGFADAFLYEGPPGWYGNNAGAIDVVVAVD